MPEAFKDHFSGHSDTYATYRPRYPAALAASSFRARFETPAPLPGYLERVPCWLITHPAPALLGLVRIAALGGRT